MHACMQTVPNKTDERLSMHLHAPHYTVFLYSFSHHASDLSDYGHDAHLYIKARGSGADNLTLPLKLYATAAETVI